MLSESEVAQSYLTLCDPMDCSLPGFSIHGIFQTRVLEWLAIAFSTSNSSRDERPWGSNVLGLSEKSGGKPGAWRVRKRVSQITWSLGAQAVCF